MDELLVSWLGSDTVYENVMNLIETHRAAANKQQAAAAAAAAANANPANNRSGNTPPGSPSRQSSSSTSDGTDHADGGSVSGEDDRKKAKKGGENSDDEDTASDASPRGVIPPFYRPRGAGGAGGKLTKPAVGSRMGGLRFCFSDDQTWEGLVASSSAANSSDPTTSGDPANPSSLESSSPNKNNAGNNNVTESNKPPSIKEQTTAIYNELGQDPPLISPASSDGGGGGGSMPFYDDTTTPLTSSDKYDRKYLTMENFVRVTKEVCNFPTFFNRPLYRRILLLWNTKDRNIHGNNKKNNGRSNNNDEREAKEMDVITFEMFRWFWLTEMAEYDAHERFFRLLKQPHKNYVGRDDFLPYIKELLNDHPGLEFLSNHAEFQEKYAITVITRIFYSVNKCHSGRITSRQIRRSDLLDAFQQVDEEEDINKVTRYFSYEHFYVLYCRFWELDHDRDYRITREDLLKYGDHSLSHMIVDRIFDAAPRPFEGGTSLQGDGPNVMGAATSATNREFLSYEDFIYFMLSEEDKSNEISVRYWFTCIDVDGDGKLNNMEMRSFYAVQLHRMQCMGHEIVPFEDMLCQMIDMIKPANQEYLVVEDFLQPECSQVSGALFDALFNLNKYLQFEQRDPFMERQKREDEFETDWDRFACIDYNRLAMEEEAREEEAMEIDWVTVDDEDDDGDDFNSLGLGGASEAPF